MSGIFSQAYHLIIFFRSDIHEVIVDRILRDTVKSYFIVKVVTCRLSCIAHFCYFVASLYFLTLHDIDFAKMGIAGYIAIAVSHLYQIAVAAFPAGVYYLAFGSGIYRSSAVGGKVESLDRKSVV